MGKIQVGETTEFCSHTDVYHVLLPPTQQQDRSCSVDALSAAARWSCRFDRSESSTQCHCAGSSVAESQVSMLLRAAPQRLHSRLHPETCRVGTRCRVGTSFRAGLRGRAGLRCRAGTLLEQLLPCSTCRSPRLRPTEAPARAPHTAQGNKPSNNPLHSVSAAFTQGGGGYFLPGV